MPEDRVTIPGVRITWSISVALRLEWCPPSTCTPTQLIDSGSLWTAFIPDLAGHILYPSTPRPAGRVMSVLGRAKKRAPA